MKARGLTPPELPRSGKYTAFQAKYLHDPAAFVVDCIRWKNKEHPADYQLDILRALVQHKRVSVRGPHGLGKTSLQAWIVLWFALTRDGTDWKIITTAGGWRQLTKFLWPEISKWLRKLRWAVIGRPMLREKFELLRNSIKLESGEAFAAASDNPDLIEGAHADHLLYIYDESKSISEATFDAAEGAFSNAGSETENEALAIACSTPGEQQGRFYDIHMHKPGLEDWHPIHITLEMAIAAGRIGAEWVQQREKQWGRGSAVFINRVLGNFATSSKDSVIPLPWVEAANERWYAWQEAGFPGIFTGLGIDVGLGEEQSDRTTIAIALDALKIKEVRDYVINNPDVATMEIAQEGGLLLDALARGQRAAGEAIVDVIGIGAGVVHRMRELGLPVRAFNASKRTELRDKSGELGFFDWRSAAWWIVREMLEPGSGFGVCLPPSDQLTGELTAPRWTQSRTDQIFVESKKTIRTRLRRSTDYADAVIMILVGPLLLDEEARSGPQRQIGYDPVPIADY